MTRSKAITNEKTNAQYFISNSKPQSTKFSAWIFDYIPTKTEDAWIKNWEKLGGIMFVRNKTKPKPISQNKCYSWVMFKIHGPSSGRSWFSRTAICIKVDIWIKKSALDTDSDINSCPRSCPCPSISIENIEWIYIIRVYYSLLEYIYSRLSINSVNKFTLFRTTIKIWFSIRIFLFLKFF